jgi:hypothetical protein
MNDERLDALLAATNPTSDASIRSLDLGAAESELMEEIMATTSQTDLGMVGSPPGPTADPRRRYRLVVGLVAAAAAIAVAIVGVRMATDETMPSSEPTPVDLDPTAPHVLLDLPGWSMDYVYEDESLMVETGTTVRSGESRFTDGEHDLSINWYLADQYEGYYDDRSEVSAREDVTVLGHPASMVTYGETEFAAMVEPTGDYFMEVRGDLGSKPAYLDALAALRSVSVEDWYAALPADAVVPIERGRVVDEMLAPIPVPSGFDATALRTDPWVKTRYHVAADVTSAVTCAWAQQWDAARTGGDEAGAQAAVDAMTSSTTWPILVEIAPDGGFAQMVWEIAGEMAAGTLDVATLEESIGCAR